MPTITLPVGPSVNNYWRRAGKRFYVTKAGREYQERVGEAVLFNRFPKFGKTAVRVAIDFHPPDHAIRDLDNLFKAILDSLRAANVFADDYQVQKLEIERKEMAPPKGKVVVTVEEYVFPLFQVPGFPR